MRIVDSKEIREIEASAIENFSLSTTLMSENIAIRGAQYIEETFLQETRYSEIILLVGSGNNGADALAVGRHLHNSGFSVRAFILFPHKENLKDEFKKQWQLAENFGVKITEVKEVDQIGSYFNQMIDEYLVIDGVLGMGLRLPLSNYLFDMVNIVNDAAAKVISLDIPTGICGDTGDFNGNALYAHTTLTIGLPKVGHFIGGGPRHLGKLQVLDFGLPRELLKGGDKFLLTKEMMSQNSLIQDRDKFFHKNDFGHSLVVGGSKGMTGAIGLSAEAALKVGAGLVTATTWEENFLELSSRIPMEIMTAVIPEDRGDIDDIVRALNRWNSIVVGPGMGRSERVRTIVLEILNHYAGPVIVDGDAINALHLGEDDDVFQNRKFPTILTPHIGEFSSFIDVDKEKVSENPLDYLREVVEKLNCCLVLKDASTYIGLPSGEYYINYFPNDGLATAGSGDVLAGMIGGLLAQTIIGRGYFRTPEDKKRVYDAICLGVYLHSSAGRYAKKELGSHVMSAGTIINYLSTAFMDLEER